MFAKSSKMAGEWLPQIVGTFSIFLTYLKAKHWKNSPLGKNSWPENYLRLPYFFSFPSNIIYNPFTPPPRPPGVSPANLPFVICSFMLPVNGTASCPCLGSAQTTVLHGALLPLESCSGKSWSLDYRPLAKCCFEWPRAVNASFPLCFNLKSPLWEGEETCSWQK